MSRNTPGNNITELLKSTSNTFSLRDLGVLWGVSNDKTLATTVYRYAKKGFLYRLRKGVYSKIPLNNLNYKEIGCAIFSKGSYLSMESVLAMRGVIGQSVQDYTFVGELSQRVKIEKKSYLCRKMSPQYLLNRAGIVESSNYSEALLERAVADVLYYSPKYYFDNEKPINWDKVKKIKSLVGY